MSRTVLHEDERGYVIAEGNELTIGSKIDDPPKVRVTVPILLNGGGGGVISYNHSRHGGLCYGSDQDEMGFTRIEQAEDVRGDRGNFKGEFNLHLAPGVRGIDVERVYACTWDRITRWGTGVLASLQGLLGGTVAPPSSAPVGGWPNKLVSPDGRVELDIQNADALGLVMYLDGKAVWSAEHGWLHR